MGAAQTNRNIFMDCEVRLVLQGGEIGNIRNMGWFQEAAADYLFIITFPRGFSP